VLDGAPVASSRTGTTGNPPSTIGDPKRVRTVPIRPDQGDMAANTPSTTPENLLPPPPARQTNGFPSPPVNRSAESRPEPAAPQARSAPPRTVTASRVQPTPSANAPLSLAAPDAGDTSTPPPAAARDIAPPPSRQASVAPAPRASSGGGGRFHVQVASQKSESDAEASYRSIQSKYSSVLGGQPHTVRRADLGTKGVYYRAMVGPFASREQAVQLCSSLKSAGGDCVVQAN
jgi:cell division protein FtsN